MANKFQIKRTSVPGRTPEVSNTSSSSYIDQGELAINTADGILYSSDGTSLLTLTPDLSTYLENIVEDTTPELGGNLDCNDNNILNASSISGVAGASPGDSGFSLTLQAGDGNGGPDDPGSGGSLILSSGQGRNDGRDGDIIILSGGESANPMFTFQGDDLISSRQNISHVDFHVGYYNHSFTSKFDAQSITSDRTITLPDATGTLALTSDLSTYLENIVEDTTPQLGGNLDMNGNIIVSNVQIGNTSSSHNFAFNTIYDGSFSYGYDVNLTGQTFGSYGRFFCENLTNGDEGLYVEGFSSGTNGVNVGFTRSGASPAVGEGAWTTCPDNSKIGAFNWTAINSSSGLTELAKFETTLVGSIGTGTSATANVSLSIKDSGTFKEINFPRVDGTAVVVSSTPTDGQYIEYNSSTGAFDPVDAPSGGGITTGKAIAMAIVFG